MKTYQKLTLSVLTLCISQQLYAETATPQTKEIPTATLDTIIITADKIERTAHDTMDSVKVTSNDQLEDNSKISDMYDVLDNTANVNSESNYSINIRGVNANGATGGGAAPTINFIVDGAIQNNRSTYTDNLSTWDIEQVEVLRGSQSTTSGQNALAGSVVVKSKDPQFNQAGKVKVDYGTNNTYQTAIVNTGAITDKLAYRISAEKRHTDGHIRNDYFNDDDWDDLDHTTVRGKLLYLINDDSDIKLTLSQSKLNVKGTLNESTSPVDYVVQDNTDTFYNTATDNASIEYNTALTDDWSIKSTTAYSATDFQRKSDNDGPLGISTWNAQDDSKQISEELLFSYDDGDKLKSVVGVYLAKGEVDNKTQTNEFPLKTAAFLRGAPLPANTKPYFTANHTNDSLVEYNNYAVFANADYKLTDKLTLLTGLRYDYDKRSNEAKPKTEMATGTGNPFLDRAIEIGLGGIVGDTKGEHINKVWLPKVGLNYDWNDNLKTGVLYKRGYRPGGASLNIVQRKVKEFKPEFTDNVELSTRYKNDDNSLAIQGNLFYTKWKDQQVRVAQSGMPYDEYDTNAGKSHLYGLEVDGAYKITPKVELTGGLGLVKTEFDEFENKNVDYAGKAFKWARNISTNLGMTYRDDDGWFLGGYVNHQGKGWTNNENTNELEPHTTANLKAGYEADNWSLSAHINNFFDKRYVYHNWDYAGIYQKYYLNEPRSMGVSASYEW